MATQEEKDGVEGVPTDGPDLLLCDFGKGECCTSLEVDVVREGERGQRL
jgi:hypothetical protein